MNKHVKVIACLFVLLLSSSPALAVKKLNWLEKLIFCCCGDSTAEETDNLSLYVKVQDSSGDGATATVDDKLDELIKKATEHVLINRKKND